MFDYYICVITLQPIYLRQKSSFDIHNHTNVHHFAFYAAAKCKENFDY
jgi:hypothetical protein